MINRRFYKHLMILLFGFIICVILTNCNMPIEKTEMASPSPQAYSLTDMENYANCWLHLYNLKTDVWEDGHECTALARRLTDAKGYGEDVNRIPLGGYDYVKQQQELGKHIPLLYEVKKSVKPCDNLILTESKYLPAGHTIVVLYTDLPNDKLYYLDQNYNNEPIKVRPLIISESERSAYVIPANCTEQNYCTIGGTIIGAPQNQIPEIGITVEAEAISPTNTKETADLYLDYSDFKSVVYWVSYSIEQIQPEMISELIGENGTTFTYFAMGSEPIGYNNADFIVDELKKATMGSSPYCVGYNDQDMGTLPDKAILVFKDLEIDWKNLGMNDPENTSVGFQFYKLNGKWELIWITPLPNFFWSDYDLPLDECP